MELSEYILAHCDKEPEYLNKIYRETNSVQLNGRMACGHLEGRILALLSKIVHPECIVEIGCFTAYSTLCLAEGLAANGILHTYECDDELENTILHNISQSPYYDAIKLHIGDARQLLENQLPPHSVDLAFIDADKRQYLDYYEIMLGLMKSGGVMIVDNTLWDGKITTENPKDKQLTALRNFNDFIAKDERVSVTILPVRDGITIIRVL